MLFLFNSHWSLIKEKSKGLFMVCLERISSMEKHLLLTIKMLLLLITLMANFGK
jgi:hypothetical protein